MEIKYSVSEKTEQNDISKASISHLHHGICCISCENIIAFTRVLYHANHFKNNIPIYTVFVADLNTPYECHKIMDSFVKISQIVFSNNGKEMLIVTSLGYVHYYAKGSALHQWENTHTSNWSGEEILLATFFHNEIKPVIQMSDVKVGSLYSDKFATRPHKPSLVNIGNCPHNGFFAISASGLIMVCILNSSGILEDEAKSIMGPVRDNFLLAAAALSPTGHIHIAAWKPEIVKCWKVELSYIFKEDFTFEEDTSGAAAPSSPKESRKLKISIQAATSFSPTPSNAEGNEELSDRDIRVTHLQYLEQEDPTNLLLLLEIDRAKRGSSEEKLEGESANKNSSEDSQVAYLLQRYHLQEKTKPLLKLFQQPTSTEVTNNSMVIKEWVCVGEWNSPHKITSIATPTRHLCQGSQIPFVITATTSVGSIHTFNKDYMMQINKFNLQNSRSEEMLPPKKFASDRHILSCCPTWTSLHLVAIDSYGSLHLLSLLKQADVAQTGSLWLIYIILLLEYSLVSQCDWLDILMSLPPTSSIQTLTDKLTETFNQHPPQLVSHLSTKFLTMKNSILRLFFNMHQKSIEIRLQTQLQATLKLFHSFRPVTMDILNHDMNLWDIIQTFLESRNSFEFLDLDKALDHILFSCNILDCQIDPSLAKDLQTLLQFATDLSLYLLLLLVQNTKYGLVKDPKILLYLREILFLARLWHRHNKLIVPQMICKSDNVDIWAQLYKLLTRLSQIIPNEPDAPFIDECIVLETQVVSRELPLFIPPRGTLGCIATPPATTLPYPIQFHYYQHDPNSSMSNINPRPLEGSLPAPQPLDPLYYHFLGVNGPLLQCTRCFAVRGSWWGVGDYVSMWEQEWADRCVCSGFWAPTISPPSLSRNSA